MNKLQIKLEELKSFLIDDGYNDSNIVYQTLVDAQKEAINYTHCSTQLKGKNKKQFQRWKQYLYKGKEPNTYLINDEVISEENLIPYFKELMDL